MAIDLSLFTVEGLVGALMDDSHGNVDPWRRAATIVPEYMPPFPRADTLPRCVVRCAGVFLRYSGGPGGHHVWDIYGDDFINPSIALLALCAAPPPPPMLKWEMFNGKDAADVDAR